MDLIDEIEFSYIDKYEKEVMEFFDKRSEFLDLKVINELTFDLSEEILDNLQNSNSFKASIKLKKEEPKIKVTNTKIKKNTNTDNLF